MGITEGGMVLPLFSHTVRRNNRYPFYRYQLFIYIYIYNIYIYIYILSFISYSLSVIR